MGHVRCAPSTGAHLVVLLVGLASIVVVLATFVVTTLVEEPATAVMLAVILLLSVGLDVGWKRARARQLPVGPASVGDGPGILQGGGPRAPQ